MFYYPFYHDLLEIIYLNPFSHLQHISPFLDFFSIHFEENVAGFITGGKFNKNAFWLNAISIHTKIMLIK